MVTKSFLLVLLFVTPAGELRKQVIPVDSIEQCADLGMQFATNPGMESGAIGLGFQCQVFIQRPSKES